MHNFPHHLNEANKPAPQVLLTLGGSYTGLETKVDWVSSYKLKDEDVFYSLASITGGGILIDSFAPGSKDSIEIDNLQEAILLLDDLAGANNLICDSEFDALGIRLKGVPFGELSVGDWFRVSGSFEVEPKWHLKNTPNTGLYHSGGVNREPSFSFSEVVFIELALDKSTSQ